MLTTTFNSSTKMSLSQALKEAGHEGWALSLEGCGTDIRRIVCEACGWAHTVKMHCKLKACPRCLSLRAFRIQKRYIKAVNRFKEPKLWTLTLKSTKQLGHGVRRIRDCFEKFRRRASIRRCLKGGIYAIEANPQTDGSWNVHIHALCEAGFRPQEFLASLWHEVTGDSYVVDVRRAHSPKRGLKYLLEYLAKGPANEKEPWPVEAIIKYLEVLQDIRLIQVFGCLLGAGECDGRFLCPKCGGDIWRIEWLDGRVEFSQLDVLWWKAQMQKGP